MSTPISGEVKTISGTIEDGHISAEGEDHHQFVWSTLCFLPNGENAKFQSPVFTVPSRDGCKWYLSLESFFIGFEDAWTSFYLRLILDRASDCKAAVAKFKLYCSTIENNPKSWQTFRFATKSENNTGTLLSFDKTSVLHKVTNLRPGKCNLKFVCKIIIENVSRDDDVFLLDFGTLLKTQQFTDFAISVGEKTYPVHKAILIAHSSVFAAMFAHNTTETRGVLQIKDMDEEIVEEMVRYIYTGQVEKLKDLAQDLLMAADKYDLKGLRIKCEEILIESLSDSNVLDLLSLAVTYNASDLKFEAMHFIRTRATNLIKTSAWENLCQLNPEVIREIAEASIFPKLEVEAKRIRLE